MKQMGREGGLNTSGPQPHAAPTQGGGEEFLKNRHYYDIN